MFCTADNSSYYHSIARVRRLSRHSSLTRLRIKGCTHLQPLDARYERKAVPAPKELVVRKHLEWLCGRLRDCVNISRLSRIVFQRTQGVILGCRCKGPLNKFSRSPCGGHARIPETREGPKAPPSEIFKETLIPRRQSRGTQ